MGVTIHFHGRLRDEGSLAGVERAAREFCAQRRWPVQTIDHAINAESDYTGVSISPSDQSEPVHLVFDEGLCVDEHVKTQFAGPELHIEIVNLLRVVEPWFSEFSVLDEGEYWDTQNRAQLELHMSVVANRLAVLASESDAPHLAMRLPSGRIVDLWRHKKA